MGYAGLRSIIIQIGGDLDILKGEQEMIELHVKEYCKNCTEFEDLAIFQSKSFFFYGGFYREKIQILLPKVALLSAKREGILLCRMRRCSTIAYP